MNKIILRDYQKEAIDSVWKYWSKTKGNPLIVAPCGAGKSLIIADLIQQLHQEHGARVLILTHRAELLQQNEAELQKLLPGAKTGFFSASLGKKEYFSPITFAGIQTIEKNLHNFDPFDICLIDECHLLPRSAQTQYGRACTLLKQMNPKCRFVGLTATPFRLDSGSLHKGEGALFDSVTYDIPVQKLVDSGYLVPVTAKRGVTVANMSGVKKRGGDFVSKEMAQAFDNVLQSACDEIIERGKGRKAWMVFCASVEQAETTKQIMIQSGVSAELITGDTPRAQRKDIIDQYKAGKVRCLVNVDVLTTGFNAPITDLLALVRATDSTSLYVQIVGRAMRTHPGKKDALLLDFGGNVERHGPIDDVIIKQPSGSGDAEAPAKACPECHSILPLSSRQCPDCLYIFPPPKPSYNGTAFDGAVMAIQRKPKWIKVDGVAYKRHKKEGKPDSVRIEYKCGLKTYKEWLLPEHSGRAKIETDKKIRDRYAPESNLSITTDVILEHSVFLRCPKFILVKQEGKYERVEQVHFGSQEPTNAGCTNMA